MHIDLLNVKSLASTALSWPRWMNGGFNVPVPRRIKWHVLSRYSKTGGTWIESGTYLGDTTKFLAKQADNVISIEPSEYLVKRARVRLKKFKNVRIVHGLSEQNLSSLLTDVSGPIYFWLDGHASGGFTHWAADHAHSSGT